MNRSYILYFAILLLIFIIRAASTPGRKKNARKASPGGAGQRAVSPAPTAPVPARWKADPECEYGEVNHAYSHENQARVAQLDGYLKAGLIDKKEYRQMLERYRRQEQYFDSEG